MQDDDIVFAAYIIGLGLCALCLIAAVWGAIADIAMRTLLRYLIAPALTGAVVIVFSAIIYVTLRRNR